jgi:hypothetical protein
LLVSLESDTSTQCDWEAGKIRHSKPRLLLKKVGEIPLGDRWDGKMKVCGDAIFLGKDTGWFTVSGGTGGGGLSHDRKDHVLEVTP